MKDKLLELRGVVHDMFRKYEKTYHVLPVTSKHNLDKTTLQRLFAGEVIIEEKMDGANIGIIRHRHGFHLQKRNSLVGQSEHEQFGFFHNWANYQNYEKIMNLPEGTLLYGELLYAVHTLEYTTLPDYVLIFDVRMNGKWLDYDARAKFCEEYEFPMVPLVGRGSYTTSDIQKLIPRASAYGPKAEGVVVKRYAKHGYFRGKFVDPLFMKTLEESDHWMTHNIRKNAVINSITL